MTAALLATSCINHMFTPYLMLFTRSNSVAVAKHTGAPQHGSCSYASMPAFQVIVAPSSSQQSTRALASEQLQLQAVQSNTNLKFVLYAAASRLWFKTEPAPDLPCTADSCALALCL